MILSLNLWKIKIVENFFTNYVLKIRIKQVKKNIILFENNV